MSESIRRELRLLKAYAVVVTLLLGSLSLAAFRQSSQKTRFTELDVERINVVEPDGKLRMIISNRPRSIGPIYKGKPFGYPGGGRPGIIFFNDEGTENGGLTFTGLRKADGTYSSSTGMSFDQFNFRTKCSPCDTTTRTALAAPALPSPTARRWIYTT